MNPSAKSVTANVSCCCHNYALEENNVVLSERRLPQLHCAFQAFQVMPIEFPFPLEVQLSQLNLNHANIFNKSKPKRTKKKQIDISQIKNVMHIQREAIFTVSNRKCDLFHFEASRKAEVALLNILCS